MNRNKSQNKQTRRQNNREFGIDNYDPFAKFNDFDRFFNDFNNDDMFGDFFNMKRLGDDTFKNMIK